MAAPSVPGWYALVAPKGTPDAVETRESLLIRSGEIGEYRRVVSRLNKGMSGALDSPTLRDRLTQLGNTVVPPSQRTPDFLAKFIPSEIQKWAVPIKESGVSMD